MFNINNYGILLFWPFNWSMSFWNVQISLLLIYHYLKNSILWSRFGMSFQKIASRFSLQLGMKMYYVGANLLSSVGKLIPPTGLMLKSALKGILGAGNDPRKCGT